MACSHAGGRTCRSPERPPWSTSWPKRSRSRPVSLIPEPPFTVPFSSGSHTALVTPARRNNAVSANAGSDAPRGAREEQAEQVDGGGVVSERSGRTSLGPVEQVLHVVGRLGARPLEAERRREPACGAARRARQRAARDALAANC